MSLRQAALDKGLEAPTEYGEVEIGGTTYSVQVRALSRKEMREVEAKSYDGKSYDSDDVMILRCVYDEDGEPAFEPADLEAFGDAPNVAGGWYATLSMMVASVHGYIDGEQFGGSVSNDRLDQIKEAAVAIQQEVAGNEAIPKETRAKLSELGRELEAAASFYPDHAIADDEDEGNA